MVEWSLHFQLGSVEPVGSMTDERRPGEPGWDPSKETPAAAPVSQVMLSS